MHSPDSITTTKIIWEGIPVTITFSPDFANLSRHFPDMARAHLQVKAAQPLPISETGYRSHFLPLAAVEAYGSAQAYVLAWLDHAATTAEWRAHMGERKQLSLF